MYIEERKNSKGIISYVVVERYIDPISGKRKKASISFKSNTLRAKRQAERKLLDKIDKIIEQRESLYKGQNIQCFGELKNNWFQTWKTTVKPQTVNREAIVLKRLSELIDDSILVEKITPLFVSNCLNEYKETYNSTHSTLQHIKCTLNKIFDYGVLHNIIPYSPSRIIKLQSSILDRKDKKRRLEAKFLNDREVAVLLHELSKRRNQNYYDLALFLIGTGCRIGEASALTKDDIDFESKLVIIDKSLQSQNLRVAEFYLDTTKTVAGERIEYLPNFALEAIKRVLKRNDLFEAHAKDNPCKAFHTSKSLFRTEYGSPITSHSFREVLGRVNRYLTKHCKAEYGFEWTKNAVPHSFRHIHITALRNNPDVPLKEIQARVGHVEVETTNGYTHLADFNQEKSVEAITDFMDSLEVFKIAQ